MVCSVNDLRCKEVINVRDGQRLGFVDDVEFDVTSGTITALVVPGPARVLGMFGRECNYVIPWCNIQKIGSDIVLVNYEIPIPKPPGQRGGVFSSFFK
mgnify:CR=1 FL=1